MIRKGDDLGHLRCYVLWTMFSGAALGPAMRGKQYF